MLLRILWFYSSSSHTSQLLLNEISYAKSLPQHLTHHRISINFSSFFPYSGSQEEKELGWDKWLDSDKLREMSKTQSEDRGNRIVESTEWDSWLDIAWRHSQLPSFLDQRNGMFCLFGWFWFFNWSVVDLQCCVHFWWTAKWLSFTYIYILFPYGLLQDIESSSLCYTVGPCCLSILCKVVYIC